MWTNSQFFVDLFTFTKEILKGKLHFVFSDNDVEIPTNPWNQSVLGEKDRSEDSKKAANKLPQDLKLY